MREIEFYQFRQRAIEAIKRLEEQNRRQTQIINQLLRKLDIKLCISCDVFLDSLIINPKRLCPKCQDKAQIIDGEKVDIVQASSEVKA